MPPTALAVGAFRPWILLSHAPLGAPLPCKRTNGTGYYLGRGKAPCVQVQVLSPFSTWSQAFTEETMFCLWVWRGTFSLYICAICEWTCLGAYQLFFSWKIGIARTDVPGIMVFMDGIIPAGRKFQVSERLQITQFIGLDWIRLDWIRLIDWQFTVYLQSFHLLTQIMRLINPCSFYGESEGPTSPLWLAGRGSVNWRQLISSEDSDGNLWLLTLLTFSEEMVSGGFSMDFLYICWGYQQFHEWPAKEFNLRAPKTTI